MKKGIVISLVIFVIVTVSIVAQPVSQLIAQVVPYKIYVDGNEKAFTNPVVTIEDSTYLPLREIAETLGIRIDWIGDEEKIVIDTNKTQSNENIFPFEENGLWGYMDNTGQIIIVPQYYGAGKFVDGLAAVRTSGGQDGKYGYINTKGEVVIPCVYNGANDFSEGIALVELSENSEDHRYLYIDTSGNVLFNNKEFLGAGNFHEGYAVVLKKGYIALAPPSVIENNRWTFINKSGEYATEQEYEQARAFKNGLACVKNNGKWGMINSKFELVVDYLYDDISSLEV